MKKRSIRLMVLGTIVVLALLVMVPGASASNVTKIMYAQSGVETFEYTAPNNGQLWVQVSWTDHLGNASSFPVSEVDAGIFAPSGQNLYADSDVKTLYAGVNPVSGSQTVAKNKIYYISIFPWVDDCTATVTMKLGGPGGTDITATRMSDGATVTSPQTVNAYAADGEVYVPSTGDWISTFQYWPGTASEYYACWNDHVYQRTTSTSFDTLSEVFAGIYYQSATGLQAPARATVNATSDAQGPHQAEWYAVDPQIWPAAAVPNVVDSGDNPKPGAVAPTKAPAWYTYSYPDDSVTTQAPGYFWGTLTNAAASKRNYSTNVSTGASFGASFSGSSITWVFTRNANGGVARVTIDAADKGIVDQYAGTLTPNQRVTYSGLGAGDHTITVTNDKTMNPASANTFITHDAFLANGKGDSSDPTPWLENNYDGATWYKWGTLTNGVGGSGATYSTSVSTGSTVACEFSGTSVTWQYVTNANCGKAWVLIDGVLVDTVDQYSATRTFGATKTYGGLANTTHIIMIANSKTMNPSSANTYINHDAFIVGAQTIEN